MNKKILYKQAQRAYYAGKPIMSDREFDKMEDELREKFPDWEGFTAAGSEKITKKRKVQLSQFMPSLDKRYPHQIDSWLSDHTGPYIIMHKLDGSSVLATYEGGRLKSLVTRGNGEIGQDITFLAPYTSLPQRISQRSHTDVRMEAILPRKLWRKYADQAENARNFVAGVLNRKLDQLDAQQLKDIRFVALGMFQETMRSGFRKLRTLGFHVVPHTFAARTEEHELSELLADVKAHSIYEADGLVLVNQNSIFDYESSDKPEWAIAFKENLSDDEAPRTKVVNVIWQISHARRWTPKIEIEPVRLDGATITYCTAHNFQWMKDKGIGKGAVVTIVRSGGVIPKITSVVKPARCVSFPKGEFEQRGKFLYATQESPEATVKNMTRFLVTCGIEELRDKSVRKLYDYGLTTLQQLCVLATNHKARQLTYLREAGFGNVQSRNILKEFEKLQNVTVDKLLIGSGVFPMGMGSKRLVKIAKRYKLTEMLCWRKDEFMTAILNLPTFKQKTADVLWEGIQQFNEMRLNRWITYREPVIAQKKHGKLSGVTATWTGYRDKQQEQEFTNRGGEVVSFSKKTQILFYKEGGKSSSKVGKAEAQGTKVMTWENFLRKQA